MSYFYRSKNISGVSINEDSLISLSTAIVERCVKMNEQAQKESREVCAQCVFFILFDGKGYKVDSIGELVKYFRQATREGANKQVISSQADSLIKISRIWADFFPANTSNQPI